MKRDKIEEFRSTLTSYKARLDQAVAALQDHYYDLRLKARDDLGSLFDSSDYPTRIDDLFAITESWPSLSPPDFLREGHESIWRAEQARMQARLEQTVIDAEQTLAEEFCPPG